ncbi:MAG: metallophosphoesterase family protein [Desulfobulbaceae bacterium]|jgi:putative phosphoesterase|nr:metallophosphoesterase family protein [Desulfobulbaceae bacterium]
MPTKILLLSDIHGNFPALAEIDRRCRGEGIDIILNCGDATVYAPFPNETLHWLREHQAVSILGNTDTKVLRLLEGGSFKKPRKAEKRIMYEWTAGQLRAENREYLAAMPNRARLVVEGFRIGLFHGSPDDDNEFLFADTPASRFRDLAARTDCDILVSGHSHTPYHKVIDRVHFLNPGSVGRMFDGSPEASYGVLELSPGTIGISLRRCPYPIDEVIDRHRRNRLPPIYEEMYRTGRKLN